jgi:hypothetical protein
MQATRTFLKFAALGILGLVSSSFDHGDKYLAEYRKLSKMKLKALHCSIGTQIEWDITRRSNCNRSKIKYLGIVETNKGTRYKVLTVFFVFSTASNMCHGMSSIQLYTLADRYVGEYNVGMPEALPDTLASGRLRYLASSDDCSSRTERVVDLNPGLPKSFFIPCSGQTGDLVYFSSSF